MSDGKPTYTPRRLNLNRRRLLQTGGLAKWRNKKMKLYTIDNALTECPEIRIGDKVYPLDDRQKDRREGYEAYSEDGADSRKSMKMIREAFCPGFWKKNMLRKSMI